MARQANGKSEERFVINGSEYKLIKPSKLGELVAALEVKSMLKAQVAEEILSMGPSIYEDLLQQQENYIKGFLDNLGGFDNSHLIGNINFFLRKLNLRMGELEQIIGVSAGYISRTAKENAAKKLSIDVVWKLARLFGVDIRTLIETDLMVPKSNTNMVVKFLDKLCRQTLNDEIKWEYRGEATDDLDEAIIKTGLFTAEESGYIVYHPKDHMNPDLKFVLKDGIFTCSGIVPGKELAMIKFSCTEMKDFYDVDFILLTEVGSGSKKRYSWEKAFYSGDDPSQDIKIKAEQLMSCVQSKQFDAELSPEFRDFISNYLK